VSGQRGNPNELSAVVELVFGATRILDRVGWQTPRHI
jgi:hypothetical protein